MSPSRVGPLSYTGSLPRNDLAAESFKRTGEYPNLTKRFVLIE